MIFMRRSRWFRGSTIKILLTIMRHMRTSDLCIYAWSCVPVANSLKMHSATRRNSMRRRRQKLYTNCSVHWAMFIPRVWFTETSSQKMSCLTKKEMVELSSLLTLVLHASSSQARRNLQVLPILLLLRSSAATTTLSVMSGPWALLFTWWWLVKCHLMETHKKSSLEIFRIQVLKFRIISVMIWRIWLNNYSWRTQKRDLQPRK